MLFTQYFSRIVAACIVCAFISGQLPSGAANSCCSNQESIDPSALTQATVTAIEANKPVELACATCGCNELCALTAPGAAATNSKDPSLLTDSLWGNLILEMAYQRDQKLQKIAKKLNIVNMGTMGAFAGIASGTLAQGIVAANVLNPPDGMPDSYAPLYIGTSLSGATMLIFGARTYLNHRYQKQLRTRQLAIKDKVEEILYHLEYSESRCPDMREALADLIGARASDELIQLWRSSHPQVASTDRKVSLRNVSDPFNLAALAY